MILARRRATPTSCEGAWEDCGNSGGAAEGAPPQNDDDDAAEFRLEYRSDWDRWFVRPFSGLFVTTDSGLYGYGGILLDVFWGKSIVTTPSFAVGYFSDGNGKLARILTLLLLYQHGFNIGKYISLESTTFMSTTMSSISNFKIIKF